MQCTHHSVRGASSWRACWHWRSRRRCRRWPWPSRNRERRRPGDSGSSPAGRARSRSTRSIAVLNSDGEVCVDSSNSSTIGGGYWPKGTADQYIFNSGLQLAGVVGPDGGPWAGDTTGAFFFDPKGTTQHGVEVEPIYNTTNSDDVTNLPVAGYVPCITGTGCAPGTSNDAGADIYYPLLQGRKQASQGDVWWMAWDGDPALNAGRKHPLGIVVETRGMGWNFPTGNEDIAYFVYTFYNVTSTNPADYVGVRDSMKTILLDMATEFQAKNNATFNVTLPTDGYTVTDLYAAFATDMDVADAGTNYSSVNLPFALGYTYVDVFAGDQSWTFDANIFAPPFFSGPGFAGIKYLKSPTGPGAIQLFSNTINGSPFPGAFNDPQNTIQLWRYLSGNISVPAGDQPCNTGTPSVSRICFINNTSPQDMRFFQSSTALTLAPGEQGSIVVAYIFAAPVAVGGCPAPNCASVKPGNPALLGVPAQMVGGVNQVDSMTGYISATDLDGSGVFEQAGTSGPEWTVVNGSLLGKSYTAQAVFDAKFLLPFAPDPPKFFLIPSNNQVTVVWQQSPSEIGGDPYYAIASDVNSALYDPNYRAFDVEGYRIYRGRVDSPDQLFLIAQFDFAGTIFNDYDGVINPSDDCAPELGIGIAPNPVTCPVAFDPVAPGVPRTVANPHNIVSPFLSTKFGDRLELATGAAIVTKMDTVVTGGNSGLPGADQHRHPLHLCGQRGPEQLPVLLCGDGVRRELGGIGADQPRVPEVRHDLGHPAGPGVEPGPDRHAHAGHVRRGPRGPAEHRQHEPGVPQDALHAFGRHLQRAVPAGHRPARLRRLREPGGGRVRVAVGHARQPPHGQRGPLYLLRRRRPGHPERLLLHAVQRRRLGLRRSRCRSSRACSGDVSTDVYFAGPAIDGDLAIMYGGDEHLRHAERPLHPDPGQWPEFG